MVILKSACVDAKDRPNEGRLCLEGKKDDDASLDRLSTCDIVGALQSWDGLMDQLAVSSWKINGMDKQ